MGTSILMEYVIVLFILVALEGLLSADNALVLAILVKPLPAKLQKKALLYGLIGAFILRFGALFLISFLANVWEAQAIGALYLMYVAIKNLRANHAEETPQLERPRNYDEIAHSKKAFWFTIVKVELTDIAFAIDSILTAVAMAISLPPTGWGHIGGMDTGVFLVIFFGGVIGLIIMRFAAMIFVKLLQKRPGLEKAAFIIIGWVSIKLIISTLAHPALALIPAALPESLLFKIFFFVVLLAIAAWGYFSSKPTEQA